MRKFALVLVACGAVLGVGSCGGSAPRGGLTVTGGPTGEISGAMRLVLVFSKPMVGKDAVGKPAAKPPLVIEPALPGEATWTDDRTLAYVPSQSLPASTKFVARIAAGTKALDGSDLASSATFEFFTERVTASLMVVGSETHATKLPIVQLSSSLPVEFDEITARCGFVSGGKRLGVKPAPDATMKAARSLSFVPSAELALATEWEVTCKEGLRPADGNLGTAAALSAKLKTYGPLTFTSVTPAGDDVVPDEDLHLSIAFSNPIAEPYLMKIEPPVKGFPDRCHDLGEPPGLSCAVDLDARTAYTVTIDAAQKDEFGQALGTGKVVQFRTTDANPTISLESGYFVAELTRPVVPVWTRNVGELSVTAVELTPANLHRVTPRIDWWGTTPLDWKGTGLKPRTFTVPVAGTKNKWSQHALGATELVGKPPGPGMYYVEIGSKEVKEPPFEDDGRQKVLVNFTDIGIVSKLSGTRGLVWATRLSTGKPLPGATVTVRDGTGKVKWTGTTDAEGAVILPGKSKLGSGPVVGGGEEGEEEVGDASRIYVAHGNDWTMLNPDRSSSLSPWNFNVEADVDSAPAKLRGFMHTDRGLYRPGEKIHVKGLARVTKLGSPLAPPGAGKRVAVAVEGPQGKTVLEAEAKLTAYGGFWFDLDLPGDARLGDYTIRATMEHGTFTRSFSVEEFRASTFEVSGKAKTPYVVSTGKLEATVGAAYLYGAPVGAATVDVAVHSRPRRVEFEAHPEFVFRDERKYDAYYDESEHSQSLVTEAKLTLDAKGAGQISVPVTPNDVYTDSDLLVRASVTAPSNEVINKTFAIPYFRSKSYFGIKSPGYFIGVNKPHKFQVVAVAPDGKAITGPAKVTVARRDWNCVWEDWGYRGSYNCKEETKLLLDKTVTLAGGKPTELELTADRGGDYAIVVEATDAKQEAATAAVRFYAWGDGGGAWRSDDTLTFDIVADKKEYKAGDTATLILKTDLAQASGLVTIERDGVIEKRLIEITPTTKHITVPITADHAPNVYVSVALVQGRMGAGPRGKPRMRMGIVNLPVRPDGNRLAVSIEPDKADYRPGAEVTATVKVADASGKPVAAEVSITAADEGVLQLIGYETPDPVPTFFAPWGIGVTSATQLEYLRDIPGPGSDRPATGGDAAGTLRSRFVATAHWTPGVVTNAAGIATVKFKAPDNLTAFRLMAVAADKTFRFGSSDKRFTVSKPLQLHQALPRFINLGDKALAGVVVHNDTGREGTATVKLTSARGLASSGPAERSVTLAKGARVPVLFELTGAELGTGTLAFAVTMGGDGDAVELTVPVHHPSPLRDLHVAHGVATSAVDVPVALPADAIPGSAELVVSVDPDGLAGLEDGLRDLVGYPYGCLEQTTSKVIPMLAARDLADTLAVDGVTGPKLEGFVRAGIDKIGRHQTSSGGFSLWPGGEAEAYYTAYALWGLHLAKKAGYRVDQTRIDEGLEYLRNDGKRPDTSRDYYDESHNLGAQAFALYVRAALGDKDAAGVTALVGNTAMPVYGKAYLARALAESVGANDPAVEKLVTELGDLAAAAVKADTLIDHNKADDWYMSSGLRSTAMVLGTLVELDPKNAQIAPLVRLIMKTRRSDRYLDTQENLYSLLALTSYARTVAKAPPNVAVALGGTSLISGSLGGKQRMRVASTALPASGNVSIKPSGEVHYNVELRYRRVPAALKAESNGLSLTTEYLDEAGKPKTAFTVGDVVRVKVTVPVSNDVSHLMVSVPVPAGFEALNTRFATVGTAGIKESYGAFREMRDNRVDFASEYTWGGRQVYEFMMRAIAVGTYAKAPTVAELMYEPEVNAQTEMATLEVKPK